MGIIYKSGIRGGCSKSGPFIDILRIKFVFLFFRKSPGCLEKNGESF